MGTLAPPVHPWRVLYLAHEPSWHTFTANSELLWQPCHARRWLPLPLQPKSTHAPCQRMPTVTSLALLDGMCALTIFSLASRSRSRVPGQRRLTMCASAQAQAHQDEDGMKRVMEVLLLRSGVQCWLPSRCRACLPSLCLPQLSDTSCLQA